MSRKCISCSHENSDFADHCAVCGLALDLVATGDSESPTIMQPAVGQELPKPALAPGGFPMLIIQRPDDTPFQFVLDTEKISIGRHPDSELLLDDITVSRRHAVIEFVDSAVSISDVGSLNGTYVNKKRTESTQLGNGDEVQIGRFRLVYFEPLDN